MLWSCRIQLPVRRGRSAGSGIAGPDPVGMPLPVAVATATRPPGPGPAVDSYRGGRLCKGTVRAIQAVYGPLAYLSVHRRRPAGLQVGRPAERP